MYTQVEKPKENKSRAVANSVGQKKSNGMQGFGLVDNRKKSNVHSLLQMQKCAQLTIDMRGHRYDSLWGENGFGDAYARHFRIPAWEIPDLVAEFIEYAFNNNYTFQSYNDLVNQILVDNNNFLPLPNAFIIPASRRYINMTGSRG